MKPPKPDDPLEAIIRPIVEGQLRSFTFDHPEVLEAVNWYKPRVDKRQTFVNSVAKRVVRSLLCPSNRVRLEAALVGARPEHRRASATDA